MSTLRRQLGSERPAKRRSPRSHLADLGDRIAHGRNHQEYEPPFNEDEYAPRFTIVKQGYDCASVDDHIGELEREMAELDQELAELRARPSHSDVQAEISRIGEQASSILMTAHNQAQETTRNAQIEADRCVADAAANALSTTEDANRQLREMESEKDGLSRQREFLIRDIRGIASALSSLADDASGRYPEGGGATQAIDPVRVEEPESEGRPSKG
jgi:hypothetical protein